MSKTNIINLNPCSWCYLKGSDHIIHDKCEFAFITALLLCTGRVITGRSATQSSQFTNSAYPLYQHMEALKGPYLLAANGLKSVILISKHLTLE